MEKPSLDPGKLELLKARLPHFSPEQQREILDLLSQYEQALQREQCRDRFIPFVEHTWPDFIAGRHHERMGAAFERIASGDLKRLIICMPPRHCLEEDTPVLTLDGWKRMDEITLGDHVFSPDGRPIPVQGISPLHENVQLYRVTTNDGASIVTDAGHRWWVRLDRKRDTWTEYTTEQLWARDQGAWVRRSSSGKVSVDRLVPTPRAARIPDTLPADLPEADLPIDPYVLGHWLGDGSSHGGTITASPEDQPFIRAEYEKRGFVTTTHANPLQFGVLGLASLLARQGLIRNKRIPPLYLTASIRQRRDLLRGLMDSGGNVSKKGQCFFAQKDPLLTQQVRELLWSLGIRNTLQSSTAKIGDREYGIHHEISFHDHDCCLLPRKLERCVEAHSGRFIRVEKLDRTGNVLCIQVPGERFVAGKGLVATLNTKSEFGSFKLPAWFLGKFPKKKVIQSSHTAELAVGFGRKVRNLISTDEYQSVFPGVALSGDSKAAGRWATNQGGEYFAIGVGGAVTGKGADLLIIDDPHSEQEGMAADPAIFESAYEWYTSGPRQRLQPGGAIVIIMTRWSKKDLVGRVLEDAMRHGTIDEWEIIEFPALLDGDKPLWPEFWSQKELLALKNELPLSKWMAQYMQQPTSEEAALVKREWWREWERRDPPPCEFIIQSWDTAFTKNTRSDPSACTTWGVFFMEDETGASTTNIILLDAFKERMEFPTLKKRAIDEYRAWTPDICIIEAKASGLPLIFEMRQIGIPVQDFTPSRGNDKISRVNAVTDLFASGRVWAPPTRFAEEVIEEFAEFPNGEHDDLVDSSTQALLRFRQGGFIQLQTDEVEEFRPRRAAYY